MVVAMHEDLRLIERIGDEQIAQSLPARLGFDVEVQPEVFFAQPVMKQRQFEAQQVLVVGRQV